MWLRRYVFSKNYITFVSKLVREYHPEHNLTYNPEDKALEWMDPAAGSGVSSAQQQKLAHRNVGLILVQFATRVVLSTLVRYKVRWKGRPCVGPSVSPFPLVIRPRSLSMIGSPCCKIGCTTRSLEPCGSALPWLAGAMW